MVAHHVLLQSPRLFGDGDRPVLLERSDARFVVNVAEELGDPRRHDEIRGTRVQPRANGEIRLYQPMHRMFHLAVVSAVCDQPTMPRLDPRRIESAGLVIRRLNRGADGRMEELAWLTTEGSSGWGLPELWDPEERTERPQGPPGLSYADPDPDRRPRRRS